MRRLLFAALLLLISGAVQAQQIFPGGGSGGGSSSGLGTPVAVSAAGANQGTATVIGSYVTITTTVGSGQGVVLALPFQIVINAGANTVKVYPNSGATITGGGTTLATNAPFSIAAGSSASFACSSSTTCYASFSSFQ